MPYTLINAGPSPFGRKIAIALLEKGIGYEVRYDLPWGDQTCTPQFSPLQQLPILITEEGESIYDSTFILEWLEGTHPKPALLPEGTAERLAAKKRQMLGERLMEIAQNLIFEMHRPEPSSAWIGRQTRKVLGAFGELEKLYAMRASRPGDPIDHGDIAVATTALLFEFAVATKLSPVIDALSWRGRYPRLTSALEALEARPSFAATLPRPMNVNIGATLSVG